MRSETAADERDAARRPVSLARIASWSNINISNEEGNGNEGARLGGGAFVLAHEMPEQLNDLLRSAEAEPRLGAADAHPDRIRVGRQSREQIFVGQVVPDSHDETVIFVRKPVCSGCALVDARIPDLDVLLPLEDLKIDVCRKTVQIVRELHCRKRSEEHTSELQSPCNLVCRLLLEKKKYRPDEATARLDPRTGGRSKPVPPFSSKRPTRWDHAHKE